MLGLAMNGVESYYDERALEYDTVFEALFFRIYDFVTWKHIEPYLPRFPGARVLDAAGGTGRWSIRMARAGCNVTLLDVSEEMLNVAREKVKKESLEHLISIEKGDIRKLDYEDETFDMALCEHAVFLLERPEEAIKEFKRVLKNEGVLIVSAQNRYVHTICQLPCDESLSSDKLEKVLSTLLRKRYNVMDRERKVRIHTLTPGEFRSLLEGNGFKVIKMIGKGITMPIRVSNKISMRREYPEELFEKLLQLELNICEEPDSLALAGHMQAIANKL